MAKFESDLDRCFSALGDPTRRGLLQRLARGAASVSELAAPHGMALPSIMEHLRKLEQAGLVASEKKGRTRTYALTPEALRPAEDWLEEQRAVWEGRLDRLDAYVAAIMKEEDR